MSLMYTAFPLLLVSGCLGVTKMCADRMVVWCHVISTLTASLLSGHLNGGQNLAWNKRLVKVVESHDSPDEVTVCKRGEIGLSELSTKCSLFSWTASCLCPLVSRASKAECQVLSVSPVPGAHSSHLRRTPRHASSALLGLSHFTASST